MFFAIYLFEGFTCFCFLSHRATQQASPSSVSAATELKGATDVWLSACLRLLLCSSNATTNSSYCIWTYSLVLWLHFLFFKPVVCSWNVFLKVYNTVFDLTFADVVFVFYFGSCCNLQLSRRNVLYFLSMMRTGSLLGTGWNKITLCKSHSTIGVLIVSWYQLQGTIFNVGASHKCKNSTFSSKRSLKAFYSSGKQNKACGFNNTDFFMLTVLMQR